MKMGIKYVAVVAALCAAGYGLVQAKLYGERVYEKRLLEEPYKLRVEDKWDHLKALSDTNRDGVIDKNERGRMHMRLGSHSGLYFAKAERELIPKGLVGFEKEIERAVKTYEDECCTK
ncbi:MAG: hypothetical protein AABX14_04305 [Candidatus Aenigmatarchaeota archaeon]